MLAASRSRSARTVSDCSTCCTARSTAWAASARARLAASSSCRRSFNTAAARKENAGMSGSDGVQGFERRVERAPGVRGLAQEPLDALAARERLVDSGIAAGHVGANAHQILGLADGGHPLPHLSGLEAVLNA